MRAGAEKSGADKGKGRPKEVGAQRDRAEKCVAVVLAAGRGKRMNSPVQKQYLTLCGKPVLYYSLKAFEDSFVDEIVLVTGSGEEKYCEREIVGRYGFRKVTKVVAGGEERYHSVHRGLQEIGDCDYAFIHDGARPFLDREILSRVHEGVREHGACVAAMPVKDTVKIADESGFVVETPNRKNVWLMQTPQAFSFLMIRGAYEALIASQEELLQSGLQITDDAMVVETMLDQRVWLAQGSYGNIKITTPEDLKLAEALME